ncbi:Pentatricopeptide repeat [Dillenia turbinata]|uniref:Pentatricopeptide repeat n=1 Tax=Dillenia turbinata TaxID=194707 RepID=A0AAN8W4C1_9MAGN
MKYISVQPDIKKRANLYAAQLQLCRPQRPNSHSLAKTIHAHMISSGFKPRGHILNRLIDIYCKSSNLPYARHLFDKIPEPDVVARTTLIAAYSESGNPDLAKEIFSQTPLEIRDTVCYNAMITGYSHNSDGIMAMSLFRDMLREGFRPDNFTFTSVLAASSLVVDEERECQQLHCAVVKSGTAHVTSVLNALLTLYVKCASSPLVSSSSLIGAARRLFEEMNEKDELTWTTMITGYVRNDNLDAAREIFDGMDEKLGIGWNAMISGYVHHELYAEAFDMFREMLLSGFQQDEFTYTSVISACANAGLLRLGKQVHGYILRVEASPSKDFVLSVNNALVTMYWRCGKVDVARHIFNDMPVKDLVSWNAILSGYVNAGCIDEAREFFGKMQGKNLLSWTVMISAFAQHGFGEEGLKLFNRMRVEGFQPCDYAFAGAITSCSVLGALELGRQLHAQLIRTGFYSSLSAGNALVTMYGRCGVIEAAHQMFLTMPYVDSSVHEIETI